MGEQSKGRKIGYWVATVLVAFAIGLGGVVDAVGIPEALEAFRGLGYPDYFATILGVWKVAGAVVILLPRMPLVKEWAYAGIAFDLTGGSASLAFNGDPVPNILVPLVLMGLLVASWMFRPAGRLLSGV